MSYRGAGERARRRWTQNALGYRQDQGKLGRRGGKLEKNLLEACGEARCCKWF